MSSFEEEAAAAAPLGSPKRLTVRRRGCGCWLGDVLDGPGGFVLRGTRRVLTHVSDDTLRAADVGYLVHLEHPVGPADGGCKHSAGELLPLADLLAAARDPAQRVALVD